MPRYIEADALREKMFHEAFEKDTQDQKWDSGCWIRYHMFENAIESAPTADVRENVHAHWEDWSFLGWDMETHWRRRCSNCLCEREDDNEEKDTLFCPNCGALMDERREDG